MDSAGAILGCMKAIYALPVDPDVEPAPAEVVNRLDVTAMPFGIHRVFVELVGDGLATGVRVPVLVARGAQPGPVFGITSAIHGNELNGIPVLHELFASLDPALVCGSLVGVIALNVPGLHRRQREYIDGADLNRIMPGSPGGSSSEVYAHRILERILHDFEYLLDLHTASFGRVNSLYVRADMRDPRTAAMAYLQHPEIIVHNPSTVRTLRAAAMNRGIAAITVEIGDPQMWQARLTRSALAGVRSVLSWAGVLEDPTPTDSQEPVLCHESNWMYTDRGGLLRVHPGLCDRVEAGETVATVRNAFGDVIREYAAPTSGIVVGRSVNPVGETGARVLHLGAVDDGSHGLLRREELL